MHTSNDHIFVLMPSLSLLFLAGLLGVCWATQPKQRFLLWLCASFLLTAMSISIRSVLKFEVLNHYVVLVNALFLAGAWCFSKSFSERRCVPTYPLAALVLCAATLASLYYFANVAQNQVGRLHTFGIGVALMLLLPVPAVLKRGLTNDWLDRILLWSYMFYAVFTMLHPTLVATFAHNGLGDAMDANSTYWLTTLMSILLFALLFTVLVCAVTIRDTVRQLRTERDLDALTQILNRRAFSEAAQHRLADQRLYPMALLASDIDHFKRINDNWGHDKGDEVLQLVARAMQHNVRSNDLVARFGGEEFMVLLTKIDLQGAEQVAKRIGLELRNDQELLPKGPALTLSFGITSISNADQLEGALRQADQLLYSAKNAGRDRVHVEGRTYPDISFEHTLPADHPMALLM
ncbi:GGDEF domain-containing protein [Comamonas thiooxydans]|uniref:diguanylate cyclase n=1 Tax=Comamonas thiooxydans TaxID=363952 RepID=A0AA42TXD8_9BURK|nr:GGDEF domain-containing protein [Comamonas thiooxydans]MDH1337278.1 GGDEF domain-containing protein [Comamonas thiooxydans]MDH1740606.1 GGDEF domain-containing protein [Comamonas thiooxydans]MDH1786918.1 GGDEF domain-containing protein [Comamonas thiooxydans]